MRKVLEFPLRSITVGMTAVQTVWRMQLYDFVFKNTLKLFTALDIPQDFFNQHQSIWENNNDYVEGH